MKQKGITLIETVVVVGLLSIIMGAGLMNTSIVHNVRFNKAVNEVEQALIYARQATVMTGNEHNIYCFSNRVFVRRGIQKPIYIVDLGEEVYIPDGCTGKKIFFCESMAVVKAGTIELISKAIKRKAEITVGIATGKVRTRYVDW